MKLLIRARVEPVAVGKLRWLPSMSPGPVARKAGSPPEPTWAAPEPERHGRAPNP